MPRAKERLVARPSSSRDRGVWMAALAQVMVEADLEAGEPQSGKVDSAARLRKEFPTGKRPSARARRGWNQPRTCRSGTALPASAGTRSPIQAPARRARAGPPRTLRARCRRARAAAGQLSSRALARARGCRRPPPAPSRRGRRSPAPESDEAAVRLEDGEMVGGEPIAGIAPCDLGPRIVAWARPCSRHRGSEPSTTRRSPGARHRSTPVTKSRRSPTACSAAPATARRRGAAAARRPGARNRRGG